MQNTLSQHGNNFCGPHRPSRYKRSMRWGVGRGGEPEVDALKEPVDAYTEREERERERLTDQWLLPGN